MPIGGVRRMEVPPKANRQVPLLPGRSQVVLLFSSLHEVGPLLPYIPPRVWREEKKSRGWRESRGKAGRGGRQRKSVVGPTCSHPGSPAPGTGPLPPPGPLPQPRKLAILLGLLAPPVQGQQPAQPGHLTPAGRCLLSTSVGQTKPQDQRPRGPDSCHWQAPHLVRERRWEGQCTHRWGLYLGTVAGMRDAPRVSGGPTTQESPL